MALMTLASVANPSPPTSFSAKQRRRTFSNTNRRVLLLRNRPWRFYEGTSFLVNIMVMEGVSRARTGNGWLETEGLPFKLPGN